MKKPTRCFLALTALLLSLANPASAASTGKVDGRVVLDSRPVAGATVFAADDPDGMFRSEPKGPVAVTDAEGGFSLDLPKGAHYIAAVKRSAAGSGPLAPGDFYCFYGGNPVTADSARTVKLVLNLVSKPDAADEKPSADGKGGVEGVVTLDGEPLDGVRLYVYLDANGEFKGMGYYMSPPTGVNGAFKMKMNEGSYYIVARKRAGGGLNGPLVEGDYFGYPDVNPVVVKKGVTALVEVPIARKVERLASGGEGGTAVSGIVKGEDGKPAKGMIVCLYKDSKMINRPAVVSKPTGADGSFRLELPVGGVYYLGARDSIGGPIEPGQLWGRYNGNPDHSIVTETGKSVEGIEIIVEKVLGE